MELDQLVEAMRRYNVEYVVTAHGSRFRPRGLAGPLERVYPSKGGADNRFEVYRLETR